MIPEQGRTGDHTLEHESADEDSRAAVARDAQGHQGDECGAGSGVVGGFRRGDAFDLALAEVVPILGGLLRLVIADKGRYTAACARCSTYHCADNTGYHSGFDAAPDLAPSEPLLADLHLLLPGGIMLGIVVRAAQQLRQGEQAHQDG